jgi:hypothetical protein
MRRTIKVFLGDERRLVGVISARPSRPVEVRSGFRPQPISRSPPRTQDVGFAYDGPGGDGAVGGLRDEGRSLEMTDTELEPFAAAFEHPERDAARRA